jgi:uncharacterized protein with HEPN domain
MVDAARETIGFTQARSRDDLDRDRQLTWALVKGVEIIGEAAYQIGPDSRAELSDILWDDIVAMRHRFVHASFDINLNIPWKMVKEHLPELMRTLESFLPPEGG